MLASPSGGGGAGVLFEGLGEGGLLRVVEPLCHRKRAICQKLLRPLHAAPSYVGTQGLAGLGLKGGAQFGSAREESLGHLLDAHMSALVERALYKGRRFLGNSHAGVRACRPLRLSMGRMRTGELGDHGLHDALHIDVPAYGAGAASSCHGSANASKIPANSVG